MTIEAGLPGAGGELTYGAEAIWAHGGGDRLLLRIDPAHQPVDRRVPSDGGHRQHQRQHRRRPRCRMNLDLQRREGLADAVALAGIPPLKRLR